MDKKAKLSIDYENNVEFYSVGINEDEHYYDKLSKEDQKKLDDENLKWIEENVTPKLLNLTSFCSCRMPEVMKRTERRAMLTAVPSGSLISPTVEQEDVDAYKFVVIVIEDWYNRYQNVGLIVRECKTCHKIDMWGDASILGAQLGGLIRDAYENLEYVMHIPADTATVSDNTANTVGIDASSIFGEGTALENIETGEWSTDTSCSVDNETGDLVIDNTSTTEVESNPE